MHTNASYSFVFQMHSRLPLLVHTLLKKYTLKVKNMPPFIQWEGEQLIGRVRCIFCSNAQYIFLNDKGIALHHPVLILFLVFWVTRYQTSPLVHLIQWHLVPLLEVSQKIWQRHLGLAATMPYHQTYIHLELLDIRC